MAAEAGEVSEICYVVHDLEKSVTTWAETIGAGPFFVVDAMPEDVIYRGKPHEETFRAALGFSGSTIVEFIEPGDGRPSIWREILDSRGETVHHVYPNLRPLSGLEYDAEIARHQGLGLEQVWSSFVPIFGRNCFFDARDRIGCFIELLEINPVSWGFMTAMGEAHRAWDGKRSLRDAMELIG